MGTGGDWSPPISGWGGPTMYWSPQLFGRIVFKKQEISQQVLLLLNDTQSFHINYSTLRRNFSRYSTSDRRKTRKMCLIPVSTLHSVYLLAYRIRTAYLDKKIHAGPALKCILDNFDCILEALQEYMPIWRQQTRLQRSRDSPTSLDMATSSSA